MLKFHCGSISGWMNLIETREIRSPLRKKDVLGYTAVIIYRFHVDCLLAGKLT